MKILISLLNFRPGLIGGTETYLRGLLPELARLAVCGDSKDEVVLLTTADNAGAIKIPHASVVKVPWSAQSLIARRLLEAFTPYHCRTAEALIETISPDVVFFPQQSMFPRNVRCPVVLTVLDLVHEACPETVSWIDRKFRNAIYPRSLQRADHLIAISDFTRDTFIREKNIRHDRIHTVRLGFEPAEPESVERFDDGQGPYLYYPAVSHPHKNHETLFRSFAALTGKPNIPGRLLLSGQKTANWKRLENILNQLGLTDRVQHLGHVTRQQVLSLYRGATAVVFPTRYEGFGLPVLEAATMGTKIICSQLPVFEELGVPAEFRIDFSIADQWQHSLTVKNQPLKHQHATWQQAALATLEVLHAAGRRATTRS